MYPKIKIKKTKRSIIIDNIIDNIRNILLIFVNIIASKGYFILFMKKCFHF